MAFEGIKAGFLRSYKKTQKSTRNFRSIIVSPRAKILSVSLLSVAMFPLSYFNSYSTSFDSYVAENVVAPAESKTRLQIAVDASAKVSKIAKSVAVYKKPVQKVVTPAKPVAVSQPATTVKKKTESSTTAKKTTTAKKPATVKAPQKSTPTPAKTTSSNALPTRISIPSIGLNAHISTVGILASGKVDTPQNDVGWLDKSAVPGKRGAAFFDGHTPGVLSGLYRVNVGNVITITMSDGTQIKYVVKAIEVKKVGDVNMSKVLSPYGGATEGLSIMTCESDGKSNSALRRTVYAVRQ